jgi:sigma-B regulation protein RsbU (phosphoserine phosphatase)
MNIKKLLNDLQKQEDSTSVLVNQFLKALLEYSAREKENDINKRLLRKLITKYALAEKNLRNFNDELVAKNRRIEADLRAAAEIQRSLLPTNTHFTDQFVMAWAFQPCEHMGGDIFNIFQVDDEHLMIYVLDVSGHGVPAAMITVSVSQFLQQILVSEKRNMPSKGPAIVLDALDREYGFERFNSFFTISYFVINLKTGQATYGNAGHPYPIHLQKSGTMELLKAAGPCIGMRDFDFIDNRKIRFGEGEFLIEPGDKIFLYTDGIVEYQNGNGKFYGEDRFYRTIRMLRNEPVGEAIVSLIKFLTEFGGNTPPQDDITLLGLEMK